MRNCDENFEDVLQHAHHKRHLHIGNIALARGLFALRWLRSRVLMFLFIRKKNCFVNSHRRHTHTLHSVQEEQDRFSYIVSVP